MSHIHPPSRYRTPESVSLRHTPGIAQTNRAKTTLMRRYEILYLDTGNSPARYSAIAPATPMFESAFSAFARGTLIKTTGGPCAVEDLEPGMMIETRDFGPQPMLWRGMMNIIPNAPAERPEQAQLTRVMADTFGMGRPASDLMLGAAAQMLRGAGADRLTPVSHFTDGDNVFQTTPPSPVQVFHICLPVQAMICANDLYLASYHPQPGLGEVLGPQMLRLFLSLFPHVSNLLDFGPGLYPERPAAQVGLMDRYAV
ncbi:Hint domain-containing protein [Thalassovita sp.]|uniref:Hint domain-containing protein n=1 Tax=Thalassovita sp. TaxID=1979401 RepID=UPI002B26EF95|nr:Hint domain-containing protein [Thalassovita sp.]